MFGIAEADDALADRSRGGERIDAGHVDVGGLAAEEKIADRAADDVAVGGSSFASAGKRRVSSSRHCIREHADPLDLDLHDVAGLQRPDAGGRAGQDHVAGHEGHDRGDELEERRRGEDHLRRASVLAHLAVHARGHAEIGRIEVGLDARPDRAERVEALAARELHVLLLQIARGDVVRAGEAAHVVAPVAPPSHSSPRAR